MDDKTYQELKSNTEWQHSFHFLEWLAGKRVILVGPANYLVGQNKGKEIDEYDVVVRMNLSCPVPEELKQDIGSRTDVLYHILIRDRHLRLKPDVFKQHTEKEIKRWKRDGVKWVVLKNNLATLKKGQADVEQFALSIKGIVNWTNVSGYQYRKLSAQVRRGPNMGTIAIYHMLLSRLKELAVVGCDFHQTPYYTGYGGMDEEQVKMGVGGPACWGLSNQTRRIHPINGQLDYLKTQLPDKRFKPDKTLRNIILGVK